MSLSKKIVSWEALKRQVARQRRQGKTIVFTNGCFDLLHYGHVKYLETAKKKNRILIVGLNSDASVRKIKGPTRPVNQQKARAQVLAALACVDFVTIFDEDTPEELIRAIAPDVLVKGADWKGQKIAGGDFVKARGGKVEFIRYVPGYSTTKLIHALKNR